MTFKIKISPYTKYGDIFMYKRKLLLFIGACFLLLAMNILIVRGEPNPSKHFIVVVDAGHGGYDGGAEGKHSVEKDINLSVAIYLKQFLTDIGIKVIMVRKRMNPLLKTMEIKSAQIYLTASIS